MLETRAMLEACVAYLVTQAAFHLAGGQFHVGLNPACSIQHSPQLVVQRFERHCLPFTAAVLVSVRSGKLLSALAGPERLFAMSINMHASMPFYTSNTGANHYESRQSRH